MATLHSALSAGSMNATVVKATSGRLFAGLMVGNVNAAVRYLKVYDKATTPDPTSDTPIFRIPIPAGHTFTFPFGYYFVNGLGYVMVTGAGDTSEDAVAENEIFLSLEYD